MSKLFLHSQHVTQWIDMNNKRLTELELDVHELQYLMDSFEKAPSSTLAELLKRNIERMQQQLEALSEEVDAACVPVSVLVASESLVKEAVHKAEEDGETARKAAEETVEIAEEAEEPVMDVPVRKESGRMAVLGENIKLFAGGLRKSISLNDSFRFSRELFGGDMALMNRTIEQISMMSSYQAAVAFLSSKVNVNEENEAVADFLDLLDKYFNQSV